jgi:hypothetical protein
VASGPAWWPERAAAERASAPAHPKKAEPIPPAVRLRKATQSSVLEVSTLSSAVRLRLGMAVVPVKTLP